MSRARYIMIGGFLGAGKTTCVAALAQHLTDAGRTVGLITNDQGRELVDTAMLRAKGFATEEIPGGCFCCRFNSLVDAAAKLTESTKPNVFIAEPVGSCTDLVATVTYPLRRIYGGEFSIAPLSVLVDPIRATRIFGLSEGGQFSEKVIYIYRKQLEEADFIVINKTDLLEADTLAALIEKLTTEFPNAEVLQISARNGEGLKDWFARITDAEQIARAVMEVDYELYAEGEALLGWLNATVQLNSADPFEAQPVLQQFATDIQAQLTEQSSEIAHLKITLSPDAELASLGGQVAIINLVRNDFVPELSADLDAPIDSAQLIINLRAEADPKTLKTALETALANAPKTLTATLDHLEHFRPGKPEPTHRDGRSSVIPESNVTRLQDQG